MTESLSRTLRPIAFLLTALILLVSSGCDSAADAGEEAPEPSAEASFAARSEAAGIAWARPAEEIDGVAQQVIGQGAEAAVILSREGREPPADAALFLHSGVAGPPSYLESVMRELTGRGYAVIYPVYQLPDTPPAEARESAMAGIRAALGELDPDPETLIAIGDVAGAAIAFDYAAIAPEIGLPSPGLLVAIQPGPRPGDPSPSADRSQIPSDTKILIATSTNHGVPGGWRFIGELLAETAHIPASERELFVAEPDPELSTGDQIADAFSEVKRAVSAWLDRSGALRAEQREGG